MAYAEVVISGMQKLASESLSVRGGHRRVWALPSCTHISATQGAGISGRTLWHRKVQAANMQASVVRGGRCVCHSPTPEIIDRPTIRNWPMNQQLQIRNR